MKKNSNLQITEHCLLATDNNFFGLTDKELYQALDKYSSDLDSNPFTVDMDHIIMETEDLFREVEPDEEWDGEDYD